jgi:hypothetical protein
MDFKNKCDNPGTISNRKIHEPNCSNNQENQLLNQASVLAGRKRLASIDMLPVSSWSHGARPCRIWSPPSSTDYFSVDFATTCAWFLLVGHPLCTFILLAGVSAALYGAMRQRSTREVARFLVSRGVWLVFIELTVVNFAWSFNLRTMPNLQVIWAIGWSMIALSGLIWLPRMAIAAVGVAMIGAQWT